MSYRWWCAAALAAAAPLALAQATEGAFNPAVSLILQGTAATNSQDPKRFQLSGFAPTGGEVGPAPRSFSLGESELVVSSNIDPYFRGQMVAALTPDNKAEVEEAFFQTLALGGGFTLKGGRFLAATGYQNEIHAHAWDFQDPSLAQKAFLGGKRGEDGVQLRWVAPTELFTELGGELGNGRSFPASDANKNGAGAWSLFGRLGGDWGESAAWRTGLTYLRADPRDRVQDDADAAGTPFTQSFTGRSSLWVADFVLKWAPNGNSTVNNAKLQGEYFRRTEDGQLTHNGAIGDYASRQSGWYLQGVWQFMPRWRVGYRYDQLDHGTVSNGLGLTAANAPALLTDHNPTRNSVMVDWSGTEFSRVRLQLASDKSTAGRTNNQVLVQYIYSLGAHGAHTF
jgi:hypothetical protein